MTTEDFALWSNYFVVQLAHNVQDTAFLAGWRNQLEPYSLEEGKQAILVVNANRTPQESNPSLLLPRIMAALKEGRRAKIFRSDEGPATPAKIFSFVECGRRIAEAVKRGHAAADAIQDYRREVGAST